MNKNKKKEGNKVDFKKLENSYICLFEKAVKLKKEGKNMSEIPLIIERLTKHGGAVGYMDAHVQWYSLKDYPKELMKYHKK